MIAFVKVLVVALLTIIVLGWASKSTALPSDTFLAGIASVRNAQSLPPLTVDVGLTNLAIDWSKTMASNGAISHSDLTTGVTANWARLGENVGVGVTADAIQGALVASPGHLANMLGTFTYVGVGTFEGGGKLWVTEKFMTVFPSVVPTPKVPEPIATAPIATLPPPPPTVTLPPPPVVISATIPEKALGPLPTQATVAQWLWAIFHKFRWFVHL